MDYHSSMDITENASLPDWIAGALRWMALLAIVLAIATGGGFSPAINYALLGATVWNLAMTVLVSLNSRVGPLRILSVAGDVAIAGVLFYFSGGLWGSIAWAGVLPIFSAALYYRVRGALLVAGLTLLVQAGISLPGSDLTPGMFVLGALLLLYVALGSGLGVIGERMHAKITLGQRAQKAQREQDQRAENERNKAIYKLISALNSSLNYQRVLDTTLDLGYSVLATTNKGDERMVAAALLYARNEAGATELRVGSARRFTPADLRISIPGTSGLIGLSIDEGASRLVKDITKDPELSRIVALRNCRSGYCIPLSTGLDTYGVLLFAHPEEDYFTPDCREILDVLGSQAVVAFQNARLYRDLELEKERMAEIQEEARKKLARDLHDGPTQSVAALAMRANFARRLVERDPKAAAEELFKIEDLARRTTKEIRHMLFTLRPLVLESQGLVAALESMAEKMRETFNQNVIIDADSELVSRLEIGKQGVIFYIAEEAVNNARKHARAAHIWVRIKKAGDELAVLEIEDDGTGFNLEKVGANYEHLGSLGMVNMRERSQLVNGVLQIDSAVDRGTRVKVVIPLSEDAADRIRRGQ